MWASNVDFHSGYMVGFFCTRVFPRSATGPGREVRPRRVPTFLDFLIPRLYTVDFLSSPKDVLWLSHRTEHPAASVPLGLWLVPPTVLRSHCSLPWNSTPAPFQLPFLPAFTQ
ncbi:rCG42399 [Rattus norvegicus]|uniref:RCG42399 n=1 Tax=Rattus norvegicus TaxID=10116 RepID=A6KG33_RAT|nr:rCG42399 [Rattus norvegicus]